MRDSVNKADPDRTNFDPDPETLKTNRPRSSLSVAVRAAIDAYAVTGRMLDAALA
jgi:hypothetical protein